MCSQSVIIETLRIVEVIAVIATAVVAVCGILAWRRQSKWQRKEDLKIRVLTNMYQIKRAIRKMRFSGGVMSEDKTPYDILMSKYRSFQEQIDKIDFHKDEIKAIMGENFLDPYDVLIRQLKDLRIAARLLSEEQSSLTVSQRNEAVRILYYDGKEDDEILKSVQQAIADMRERLSS